MTLQAQLGFEYNDSIVVIRGTDTLKNPWAGGLNYAQISDFDFDLDGDMDLFVFDRSSHNVRVFTQENNNGNLYYQYVHDASNFFPNDLKYRAHMVDYDADGRNDLFTWGLGGLKVYRNVSDLSNGLQWSLFQDIVYSEYAVSGISNLYISSDDIPAYVDVDGDGDLDVLTPDAVGRRIEYHQNQSIELYGIPDSLHFIQKNECWGKFTEDVSSSILILNDQNAPCVGGNISNPESSVPDSLRGMQQHTGGTLLALDMDSSGVMDLVLGDDSYNNLTLTINGGTTVNSDSPMISFDDAFPSNTIPVKCYIFPAAFFIDVDFDGIKDLLACPNSTNNSFNESSVMYYKNIGTNGLPVFIHTSYNFLQEDMIEHGSSSIPVLFDYDEDGLKDLLVANYFRYIPIMAKESTIAYYKNIGTIDSAVYQYIDYDIFNLSSQGYGLRSVPAFGDLDNDGDHDLILGLEDGSVVYYPNQSSGTGAIWGAPVLNYTDNLGNPISSGTFCHPQLFDINEDGKLDLLLGNGSGNIVYYQNTGTVSAPSFELMNSTLGQVSVAGGIPIARSAPHFFRDSSGIQLFTGSLDGTIAYYTNIEGNLQTGNTFTLSSPNYLDMNVGSYSSCWVDDIDNDENLNLFIGQDLGGLWHYEVVPQSTIGLPQTASSVRVVLFPNPTSTHFVVQAEIPIERILLQDVTGKQVLKCTPSSTNFTLDVSGLSKGIYHVLVDLQNGTSISKKLVITE